MTRRTERLAVLGGPPVRDRRLPYACQSVHDDDIRAVLAVLHSDWLTTGPAVVDFEEAFAARVGARYAVSFSSGTAALHGAAAAAGLGPRDEAITSPLTFCATANCIVYRGATPVFADVDADTLTIDPAAVARRITSATRAILPVDYAGHPADLDALGELAERHGLVIIEDACHALGATLRGRPIGSLAHLTVFSFHPVKHITTGEGGMVATNDPELARRLRLFRNHGIERDHGMRDAAGDWHYEMVELGYNYRLSDIGCALGHSQLQRLQSNVARRREIAAEYGRAFAGLPVQLPGVRPGVEPAWHLYPVQLELERMSTDRAGVFRALRAEGLGVNVHYIPVHLHPYYRRELGTADGMFGVAERAYERLISLPMFHGMTESDVSDVVTAVEKVLRHFAVAA